IGLGVGIGLLPGVSAGLFGNATATAPPSSGPVEQESTSNGGGPVHVVPFRARAQALSSTGGCVLGSNLAYGQGSAVDVSLVGLTGLKGLMVGDPGGAGQPLSRSESRTVVVPGSTAGRLGLMGETSQLLGPVTVLAGTASETTVELKGQWLLRATADGKTGSISYGPQNLAGDQALVVARNAAGVVVAQASASQLKLGGAAGVHLDIPGVGQIVVGEQPRARGRAGAAQASGTNAEAAVDLVRIRLLGQDVRLGHMEAAVAVPPGGLTCPGLEVSVTPDATTLAPGSDFGVKVRVRNPNEGTVSGLTVASRMAADPGVAVDAAPAGSANLVAPNGAGFTLTSPLGSGQSVELPGRVRVGATSSPGRVRLGASATGHYGAGSLAVPTTGDVAVDGPLVIQPASNPSSPPSGGSTIKNPVGGKAPATASASSAAGSGGRKPIRVSAGVSGAAGSAASAAPVAPAPTSPGPTPAPEPAPPVTDPTSPAPAPAAVPPVTAAGEQTAAPRPRVTSKNKDRGRYAWAGAAAVLLAAVAAAGVARLTAGARR
ncbi:MAG TPA: hypothetical protein VGR20_03110, partial [Acidimicrobiia bacterium]|nr:hypothetical protein [Acidimicrobiia bacterium]